MFRRCLQQSVSVLQQVASVRQQAGAARGLASSAVAREERVTGANYFNDGQDPIIKDDSQYPEWLWGLSEVVDVNSKDAVKDRTYWRKSRKLSTKLENSNKKQAEA